MCVGAHSVPVVPRLFVTCIALAMLWMQIHIAQMCGAVVDCQPEWGTERHVLSRVAKHALWQQACPLAVTDATLAHWW